MYESGGPFLLCVGLAQVGDEGVGNRGRQFYRLACAEYKRAEPPLRNCWPFAAIILCSPSLGVGVIPMQASSPTIRRSFGKWAV